LPSPQPSPPMLYRRDYLYIKGTADVERQRSHHNETL
jgi:hypothetical protein